MLKLIAFLMLLLPNTQASIPTDASPVCTCPVVANLEKTGETSNSISYSWDNVYSGAQYRVWYTRAADNYTSDFSYTYNNSFTFNGLSAGSYTFYFQTICGEESSSYIGVEDIIF